MDSSPQLILPTIKPSLALMQMMMFGSDMALMLLGYSFQESLGRYPPREETNTLVLHLMKRLCTGKMDLGESYKGKQFGARLVSMALFLLSTETIKSSE